MTTTLHYGMNATEVLPPYEESARIEADVDGRRVERLAWRFEGRLIADGAAAVASAKNALASAFAAAESDFRLVRDGVEVLRVAIADCLSGPRVANVEFPAQDEADGVSALPFSLLIEASRPDVPSGIVRHDRASIIATDAGGRARTTHEGTLEAARGADVRALETAALPAVPAGSRRIEAQRRYDAAYRTLHYRLIDETVSAELPAGLTSGEWSESETFVDGMCEHRRFGVYRGPTARALVEALIPAGAALSEYRVEERPNESAVHFAFAWRRRPGSGDSNLLSRVESTRVETADRFIDHKVLARGQRDYRQRLSTPDYHVEQSGEAVGVSTWPTSAQPWEESSLTERVVEHHAPERDALGRPTRYRCSWRYRMKPLYPPSPPRPSEI